MKVKTMGDGVGIHPSEDGNAHMQIAEFARVAGVTPRILRHYEEKGLLSPRRTAAGYREYEASDVAAVHRIRRMIEAGLSTRTIAQYLDCVRDGRDASSVDMCPALRAELDAVAGRLDAQQRDLERTRDALCALNASALT